jgi:hypothetical protein
MNVISILAGNDGDDRSVPAGVIITSRRKTV